MKIYTVYVERDVRIDVRDDRFAAQVADQLGSEVDAAIRAIRTDAEIVEAHTTAHRGTGGKMIYDSKDENVA